MVEVANLSNEQLEVAQCDHSAKVQAFAGSGKSTALLGYTEFHKHQRILYLCFNRPNKLQFNRKIKQLGLDHVTVETAHGLARRGVYGDHQVDLTGSFSPVFIKDKYAVYLKSTEYEDQSFVIYHALRLIKYFCASNQYSISAFNYIHFVKRAEIGMVELNYDAITQLAYAIMNDMEALKIPVLHDYYLKKFHLSKPDLGYDTILYDEVQDCSPVMIDIVENQQSTKIYCGDPHQSIYAWRGAVNAFEYIDLPVKELNTSYRFGGGIAKAASNILLWKNKLGLPAAKNINVAAAGPNENTRYSALIARSTAGLLREAIGYIRTTKDAKICFQGGLSGYTYHELGFTVLELYDFYNQPNKAVRAPFLHGKTIDEIEAYAAIADDHQLKAFIKLCKDYGKELPSLLYHLKKAEVPDLKESPEALLLSTAHRVKGLEFKEVTLANDFYSYHILSEMRNNPEYTLTEIVEEINILYVSLSRAASDVWIPDRLLLD